ncbi:hypothetical protein M9978_08410 [Sphingomonas sp. MG17]|uniref:Lipoprotein n=1 Tax=Sphingomonas tagetis TaxID=2949092 RepID=A0A9X2KL62_9SPHN|nr:hypothetical protein [Sphingomonas tagetis]MCP3730450.1 hypothetical protein [Sphingomonas tagetis]
MRRLLVLACVGALLTACTTGPPPKLAVDPVAIDAKIEKAAQRFEAVKGFAELLLPFVGDTMQANVRAGIRVVETAIAAARAASDSASRLAEIDRARRETERIAGFVGVPPDQ